MNRGRRNEVEQSRKTKAGSKGLWENIHKSEDGAGGG